MNNLKEALQRIEHLDFAKPSRNHNESEARLLIQEHFRRVYLWTQALNVTKYPLVTLARTLEPGLELPKEVETRLINYHYPFPSYIKPTIIMYFLWSMIAESQKLQSYNLPDPYEPLIQFYEGGSFFRPDQGSLILYHFNGAQLTIPKRRDFYDGKEPFIEI